MNRINKNIVPVPPACEEVDPECDGWAEPQSIKSEIPSVMPFDFELVPEAARAYVKDVSHRAQCSPDFVAVSLMITAAAVIGTNCAIRPKQRDTWTVVPNMWGGAVAKPGVMKSHAIEAPMKLLNDLENEQGAEHEKALKAYEVERACFEAQKSSYSEQLKKATTKSDGLAIEQAKQGMLNLEEPAKPIARRYWTSDATIEKAGELLKENPAGLLIYRDELTGWLKGLDREDRTQDRAFYLELWNGTGSYTFDRIARGTNRVPNMCGSILGSIQPNKLMPYVCQTVQGTNDDGLLQRLQLLVYPDDLPQWTLIDEYPDIEANERVLSIFKFLASTNFKTLGGVSQDGKFPYLRFSPDAQALFNSWLTKLETQKLRSDDAPALVSHLAKYRSLMPSLALVIHLLDIYVAPVQAVAPVSYDAAQKAINWCDYLETHARRIYGIASNKSEKGASQIASKILSGKLSAEGFTLREVYSNDWQYLNDKQSAQAAIDVLLDANWLREETQETGGRPSLRYLVNPRVFKMPKRTSL